MTKEQIKRLKGKYAYAFEKENKKTIIKENVQPSRGCCDFTCCFTKKEDDQAASEGSWKSALSSLDSNAGNPHE